MTSLGKALVAQRALSVVTRGRIGRGLGVAKQYQFMHMGDSSQAGV